MFSEKKRESLSKPRCNFRKSCNYLSGLLCICICVRVCVQGGAPQVKILLDFHPGLRLSEHSRGRTLLLLDRSPWILAIQLTSLGSH